jgi:hypothetical protein
MMTVAVGYDTADVPLMVEYTGVPAVFDVFWDFPDLSSQEEILEPELKVKFDEAFASSQIWTPGIRVGVNGGI